MLSRLSVPRMQRRGFVLKLCLVGYFICLNSTFHLLVPSGGYFLPLFAALSRLRPNNPRAAGEDVFNTVYNLTHSKHCNVAVRGLPSFREELHRKRNTCEEHRFPRKSPIDSTGNMQWPLKLSKVFSILQETTYFSQSLPHNVPAIWTPGAWGSILKFSNKRWRILCRYSVVFWLDILLGLMCSCNV